MSEHSGLLPEQGAHGLAGRCAFFIFALRKGIMTAQLQHQHTTDKGKHVSAFMTIIFILAILGGLGTARHAYLCGMRVFAALLAATTVVGWGGAIIVGSAGGWVLLYMALSLALNVYVRSQMAKYRVGPFAPEHKTDRNQ